MEDAQGKIKFANIPNEIDTYLTLPNRPRAIGSAERPLLFWRILVWL